MVTGSRKSVTTGTNNSPHVAVLLTKSSPKIHHLQSFSNIYDFNASSGSEVSYKQMINTSAPWTLVLSLKTA